MSLFPRINSDLAPLFRLMNDELTSTPSRAVRSFQPRFDVREEKDAFELHGELPGIEQKDVNIEFTDGNTILITGRTVRETTQHNGGPIHGEEAAKRIEDTDEGSAYHKPTVEEEGVGAAAATSTEVVTQHKTEAGHGGQKYKYWVSERSVGEFHRSFTFPGRIDQDGVRASLKNGILSIVVPKSQKKEARRIQVE